MNKLKYAFFILVIAACGNNDKTAITKSPSERALALRDSAVKMSAKNSDEDHIRQSLALLDEAIALDPENRGLYNAKMNIYSKAGNYEGVTSVLEKLDGSKLKDPYSTLQLGMEYELRGRIDDANKKYSESVEAFVGVADTMKVDHRLKRNTILMNIALAASLSGSADDKEKLDAMLSDLERENLNKSIDQIYSLPREELLKARRNM